MIKSAFQNHFASVPQVKRPRSQFKRVSRHKHTFDEGLLIPFYLDDVLPGDTFNVKADMFARLATPIFPIMDNMYLEVFWFFVPNRLVWDNFVRQHGERPDPDSSVDFTTPAVNLNPGSIALCTVGSLWDNFGLPMAGLSTLNSNISVLPFRMYNLIWNEWFRDQDLQDSVPVPTDNGPDPLVGNYQLLRINKYKDYFTTARPAPQKGEAVTLPIAGQANVVSDGTLIDLREIPGGSNRHIEFSSAGSVNRLSVTPTSGVITGEVFGFGDNTGLQVDFDTSTGITINEFRELVTIQQVYELDMRGGTRYIEMLFNHFGVINPDFRLQRPEFLGYSKTMVNIHPIAQTSNTADDTTPQGNLAAFGTAAINQQGFVKSFTEFGYVMGLIAVRSDVSYQEGLDRHWSRQTRFDYYYPTFANLGEMAILNREIYVNPSASTGNNDVFGYQEHWAEYRYKTSKVTGLFRSSAPQSLDAWHLAQEFDALPTLSSDFVEEDAPVDRTIAVPSEPHFIFDSIVTNITARPMPTYSAPGLFRI